MTFMFEHLEVYQKSVNFPGRLLGLTETFPKGYRFLADQLNRATSSIAANIAEGNGRFTKAERKNFFGIACGSPQECVSDRSVKASAEEVGSGKASCEGAAAGGARGVLQGGEEDAEANGGEGDS